MDAIHRLVLERAAGFVPREERPVYRAVVQRLVADSLAAARTAPAAWPAVPEDGSLTRMGSAEHERIHVATGLDADATDEGLAAAVEAAFLLSDAQARELAETRDALGEGEGRLVDLAKEAMRQRGEALEERDEWRALAQENADAAATRDVFDAQLTQIRERLPEGVESDDLVADVIDLFESADDYYRKLDALRSALPFEVSEPEQSAPRAADYIADLESRLLAATAERDAFRALVPNSPDPLETLRNTVSDVVHLEGRLRAAEAKRKAPDAPPEKPAPEPVQTSAPAPKEAGEGTLAMVEERIQAEEQDREARIGRSFDAVAPLASAIASRIEVQVGPLSEILQHLVDGKPGTARQLAGALLKEDARSAGPAELARWLSGHLRNLVALEKPEDRRAYRARFTAAAVATKKASKVAA